MIRIRSYQNSDDDFLIRAIAELQSYEAEFERDRDTSEMACIAYLSYLKEEVSKAGAILIVELNGMPIGFSCLLLQDRLDEILSTKENVGMVSDLFIEQGQRSNGYGTQLLESTEKKAHEMGASKLSIGVLARNESVWNYYKKIGYRDRSIQLVKRIEI